MTIINLCYKIHLITHFYVIQLKDISEGHMMNNTESLFVGVETIERDLGISRPKAYKVIKEMNASLKESHPNAIIIAGKVNRAWYNNATLQDNHKKQAY